MNQSDAKGQKQGMWWAKMPPQMGERGYYEWGVYSDSKKNGLWYRMDDNGELISIEHYRNNLLDGESKYFDDGHLTTVGTYYALNATKPIDSVVVIEPVTHEESLVPVRTEVGSVRHGWWRYYDPKNGRLTREDYYQADDLMKHKEFPMSAEDSTYYKQRDANLPHMKKSNYYKPPEHHSLTK